MDNTSKIFTNFDTGDVVSGISKISTDGIFAGATGSISTFYTSSNWNELSSSHYYWTIYDGPNSGSNNALFDITYGNGWEDDQGITDTYDDTYDVAYATSNQYMNAIQNKTDYNIYGGWIWPNNSESSTGSFEFFAINFKRTMYKEGMDPYNWALTLTGSDGDITLTDETTLSSTQIWDLESPYNGLPIVTGSVDGDGNITGETHTNGNEKYGLAFHKQGILLLNPHKISQSIGWDWDDAIYDNNSKMIGSFYNTIDEFRGRSCEEVTSEHYFVRLHNSKYNYSQNRTWLTGSSFNKMKFDEMHYDPRTYVTTIGLYNDNNELLAISRLSKPKEKSFNNELLVKVRIDY